MNLPYTVRFRAAVLLAGLFLLVGCASQDYEAGTKISADSVAKIKKGVMTRSEVEALLGPPAHVNIMPEGKRVLLYSYTSNKVDAHAKATAYIPYVNMFAGGAKAEGQFRTQSLQVVINAAGVVEDYEFSDDTTHSTTDTGGILGLSSSTTSNTTGSAVTAADSDKK